MAQVTICVPAFRSAPFIEHTLSSLAAQTETDFVVDVAIEAVDAQATLVACRRFCDDSRFRFRVNPTVLGWDANVRQLLHAVDTPYFAILPHDDLWHPEYLATLLPRLTERMDATVAYADMYLFGENSGVRGLPLPDLGLSDRLLAFFLGGAEAVPWRGVARSSALYRPFPGNEFSGFAVEVEWALHLLTQGAAVYVERPLYLKRARTDEMSVSAGWRFRMPEAELRQALEHHRSQLLAVVASAPLVQAVRRHIELAAEAAMLRRWVIFSNGRFDFGAEQQERVSALVASCRADGGPLARRILGRADLALSIHMLGRGDIKAALEHARQAVDMAPDQSEAVVHLARLLMRQGRTLDALPLVYAAARLVPLGVGLRALEETCRTRLDAMFPYQPDSAA